MPTLRRAALTLAVISCIAMPGGIAPAAEAIVYAGTYTGGKSQGIYILRLDLESGALVSAGAPVRARNPSFLAIHPNGKSLYAVGEIDDFKGGKAGAVSAFAIAVDTGALTHLNDATSGGAGPCHLVVDRSGRNVLVANYGGGSVAALRIADDGRLGEMASFQQHKGSGANPSRQEGPHAHSVGIDPQGRFALAADLGLDKVVVYRFNAERGSLASDGVPAITLAPGAGPRHLAFHPSGRFLYVINELDSTVAAFAYDAERGAARPLGTATTLPAGFSGGSSTAEVQVHPSGRFLYGSNRGHDSIAVFAIDPETGKLTAVEHEPTQGKTPRNFSLDPDGRFLLAANQGSDSIVVFRVDAATGRLEPAGHTASVPSPVCLKFLFKR